MLEQPIVMQIINRLSSGENFKNISADLNIPVGILAPEFRRATGKGVRAFKPVFGPKQQAAINMVKEGFSLARAAAVTGVSRQAVHMWVKAADITSSYEFLEQSKEKAKKLIREGTLSFKEVVAATGLSTPTVGKIVLSIGIEY